MTSDAHNSTPPATTQTPAKGVKNGPANANPMSGLMEFWQSTPLGGLYKQAIDYSIDAVQRQILFLDLLRQRGNIHFEQAAKTAPNVLHFDSELLLDGRELLNPINYMLLRILPPEGVKTDPKRRPFVVFDPRGGHGPGIGGMKKDSEIGIALRSGHPCYFVSFLPEPVPGQTIEDVYRGIAVFVKKIIEWHPDAEKPCLIGNCQAGWMISMMAAVEPELPGVLILAGAPMSYWAGVHGQNPMRLSGGILGGAWLTSFTSDMSNGIFDGAWLVKNFEGMNPANTLWKKNYNVITKIDTEGPRFLEFERWWGSPVLFNADEIQFIVDELFIGNHLSSAKISTSGGMRIDLRNIQSPIVVFCSKGDNITPPQQALDWVLDMYACDDEIIASGQTIIYSIHKNIGHLGIFVAGSVATKEHQKFIHNIDLIDALPPGLYETVFAPKTADSANAALAEGDFVLRFEKRSLEDLRALGSNDREDELRFAAVSRISENLQGLYNTFASPFVRAMSNEQIGEMLRHLHPLRFRFEFFSDKNPLLTNVPALAEMVRENRRPLTSDNIFWTMQETFSNQLVAALDAYRDNRDKMIETIFMQFFGSPLLQAAVGLRTVRPYTKQSAGRDLDREQDLNRRLNDLLGQIETGGLPEALVRGLLYVSRAGRGMDEREFRLLRQLYAESKVLPALSQSEYKKLVRQQYMMLLLDEEKAIGAIPTLLCNVSSQELEAEAVNVIRRTVEATGAISAEERRRLELLEKLFTPSESCPRRRGTDKKS